MTLRDELPSTESRARPRATPEQRAHGTRGRTAFSSRVTHAVPSRVRRIIINIYSRTHRASPRASPGPFATCVDPSMTRESLWLSRVRRRTRRSPDEETSLRGACGCVSGREGPVTERNGLQKLRPFSSGCLCRAPARRWLRRRRGVGGSIIIVVVVVIDGSVDRRPSSLRAQFGALQPFFAPRCFNRLFVTLAHGVSNRFAMLVFDRVSHGRHALLCRSSCFT